MNTRGEPIVPTFVSELSPAPLWSHFDRLLAIPRASGEEEAVRAYVRDVAERRGLPCVEDDAGNLLVRKPATTGREEAPIVVLQAHLDMVHEKNADVDHDFAVDPIVPVREGDWLKAEGTTLGADNGIGVAAMLALTEDDETAHGPLELLFTVDEETGLTGARSLADDLLEGRLLINLDSEEEGVITIGCAGGGDSVLRLPLAEGPRPSGSAIRLHVEGLKGGHSGVDIHRQRGNAIRVLVRALLAGVDRTEGRLADLRGGNARNAIPREASGTLWLSHADDAVACRAAMERELAVVARELVRSDPEFRYEIADVSDSEVPEAAWDEATTRRVLDLLSALPHGVMAMSLDLPGLVETSTNVAVARPEDGRLFVMCHSRSSIAGSLEAVRRRIRSIGELAGADISQGPAYPGWQPDVDSDLLEVIRSTYEEATGEAPEVGAMHAGLECGIIGEKYEGMDMVSFGPQIEFPHSPDERVLIESVGPFHDVLCLTLEHIAGRGA